MDKSVVSNFTGYVEQLRNTECSQKEKIACFQHIAECIISPALAAHINYATHINMATTVLLLFCEDLDSVVRMSAEENLNKIFRALEKTRVSRILMDLYGEIKRNGNQRSLRICLNLFAYYAPYIREKNIKWYAIRMLPCLQTIAQRKETQLCETLCEFVKSFGKYLQMGLTDSEICKLFEGFLANIGAECAVKRRCSAQNCISLIENARNKSLMAKHGLNKAIELLLSDQQNATVLGVLGFLRLLLPLIIHGFRNDCSDESDDDMPPAHSAAMSSKKSTAASSSAQQEQRQQQQQQSLVAISSECRQIIEIYDYCLHLLSISNTSNHSTINAALEVINGILQAVDNTHSSYSNNGSNSNNNNNVMAKSLQQLLSNQQLQHAEYLRRRKSLKNQIFQLRNYEVPECASDGGVLLVPAAARCQGAAAMAGVAGKVHSTGSAKIINAGDELEAAHKLRMQNVANAKMSQRELEQQQHKHEDEQREGCAVASAVTSVSTLLERNMGIAGVSAADERQVGGSAGSGSDVVDDVDLDDNDDEVHVANTTTQQQQQSHMRHVARSISECVVDDEAAAADLLAAAAHTDVEADDDDDDFTTLSEINEPQQRRKPTTYTLTTTIDVDNLIDAIDAANITDISSESNSGNARKTQEQPKATEAGAQLHEQPQNLLTPGAIAAAAIVGGGGGDDKSQHLSDIDNESFNSIDFEAEITIAGIGASAVTSNTTSRPTTTSTTVGTAKANVGNEESTTDVAGSSKSSSDTIGSFFNNLISNAASESVSKLFRPTAATRSTPIKSASVPDKVDVVSTTSTPTSAAVDSLSMISSASSSNSKRDQHSSSADVHSPSIASSSLGMHDDTPSTAVLADASVRTVETFESDDEVNEQQKGLQEAEVELRRIPNVNPFLSENSPLKQAAPGFPLLTLKIGSIYEQSIVFYTARLIAARFLLTGQAQGLQNDTLIRISIKSLSLCVLAHCVRIAPAVLQMPLEITEAELRLLEQNSQALSHVTKASTQQEESGSSKSSSASGSPCMPHSDSSSGSSNLGKDYEHLDARGDLVDFPKKSTLSSGTTGTSSLMGGDDLPADSLLLDIIDDHFGKSTCEYLLQSSELSKSADPVLLAQQVGTGSTKAKNKKALEPLSKSEIIEMPSRRQTPSMIEVTEAAEDAPPQMLPPRPPKRTKSLRKSIVSATATVTALAQIDEQSKLALRSAMVVSQQQMADILLYYNHADPMLRGGVQQIIGSFIQSTAAGLKLPLQLNLQHLLAMLLKGLQDDIHTVVIQALNAFDKIFPHVVSKYLIARHQQQQQQPQQRQKHAPERGEAVATGYVRKCQDNAVGQVAHKQQKQKQEQEQLRSNDAKSPAAAKLLSSSAAFACSMAASTTTSMTCPRTLFNDNDELIAALLNDFQLQSKSKCSNDNDDNTNESTQTTTTTTTTTAAAPTTMTENIAAAAVAAVGTFSISPKLLLNKLRLCHYNKYWLVQNKYAEVISNLNYIALRTYCCHNVGETGNANNKNDVNATLAADDGAAGAVTLENADEEDIVCTYEAQFLDELLQLIGDDDFRVREHAAQCLCRFIIQNAKQQPPHGSNATATTECNKNPQQHVSTTQSQSLTMETYETNFNLLWDFFDYRVFSSMSLPLRNLFRSNSSIPPPLAATESTITATTSPSTASSSSQSTASAAAAVLAGWEAVGSHGNLYAATTLQRQMAAEQKNLAKVLYRMTNKLMTLDDKNVQFGIIYALRVLLQHFNFIDYQRAWMEFNFMEICMRFSYYNYATAVDLSCQNDLIDVTGKLMAGYFLVHSSSAEQQSAKQQLQQKHLQQQLDQLLTHIMKILNIYYHLCSNQKPLLFAKVQKSDLFANARELALVQSVGYFGSDYVYIKLYNILRSANDSYKITINQESGRLLISLLRTCLNTLSLCIELRTHVAAHAPSQATPTHSGSGSGSGSNNSSSSSTDAGAPSSAVLKLIEETLQYLTKLVNYAPGECIACLRQLLKYLFGQNYGNRQRDYYATFVRPYFVARRSGQQWGVDRAGGDSGSSNSSRQDETMSSLPPVINSSATNTAQQTTARRTRPVAATKAAAAFATATARVTATATAIGAATATAMGMAAATTTMTPTTTSTMSGTSSTVAHNERNVIGMQTSYDSGSAVGGDGGGDGGGAGQCNISSEAQYYRLLGELFASGVNLSACKSEFESECVKHIKLFEPLVIHCLMLFLKSNAKVQAPILDLLSQLLDLNVTYSVLDSKNVIFDQIISNLDLIENGIARNGHLIIPSMIKFLIQLTHKSDRKLITIPKIISITNNLLANNAVRDCAVLALKSLSYEIFFMSPLGGHTSHNALSDYRAPFQSPVARSPLTTPVQQRRHAAEEAAAASAAAEALLASSRELDTQKEVVLGMLEKFLDASPSQIVIGLLLLRERSARQLNAEGMETKSEHAVERKKVGSVLESTLLQDSSMVYAMICRAMCEGRLAVSTWNDFYILETCFKNYEKNVLANSKDFLALLQLFITKDVSNFCDLSYATIILANVIRKTEEIYLVNHIKLYLKNHPAVEERALCAQRARQQQRQEQLQQQERQQQLWLLDGPSTSSAAAALAAAMATLPTASAAGLSEINYFAQVLCEKLEACFDCLNAADCVVRDGAYCRLVARFVAALHAVCCRSRHKDALQSVFRLVLAESEFLNKYYSFAAATPTVDSNTNDANCVASMPAALQLQLQVFKLLSGMKLLDAVVLLQLQRQQHRQEEQQPQQQSPQQVQIAGDAGGIKWRNVQRILLREICQQNPNPKQWTMQQVQQLLSAGTAAQGGGDDGVASDAAFLNFLIADNFAFVGDLCEVDAGFCSLWQRALLQHANALNKYSIRALAPLLLRLCSGKAGNSMECVVNCLQLLLRLHVEHASDRALQARLERLARRLVAACALNRNALQQQLLCCLNAAGWQHSTESFTHNFLKELTDNQQTTPTIDTALEVEQQQQHIIDEKWLLSQLIKFSTQPDYQEPQQLARILLEIQSEHKLHKIFNSGAFDAARVLRHAIASSLLAMLGTFRINCIQHNPHIHYMQPNPLVRVSCAVLMTRIAALVGGNAQTMATAADTTAVGHREALAVGVEWGADGGLYLCGAVIALIECIKKIETTALLYIESRFIDKFVHEHLLRSEYIAMLLSFLQWCCMRTEQLLQSYAAERQQQLGCEIRTLLRCIEVLLQQKFIWHELNQTEKLTTPNAANSTTTSAAHGLTLQERNVLLCRVLDVLVLAARQALQNTIFYKRYKALQANVFGATVEQQPTLEQLLAQLEQAQHDIGGNAADIAMPLVHAYAPKAVFLAKLIETKVDVSSNMHSQLSTGYITGGGAGTGNVAGSSHAGGGGSAGGGGACGAGGANSVSADIENGGDEAHIPMHIFESIGIALLRTNQFYAYAVTPFEIIQQQQREQQLRLGPFESPAKRALATATNTGSTAATATGAIAPAATPSGKLPTIPVESLSDVDVLRKFVKRLSIFGFTTRQQFEEYFMTFLLLINKVYDENMVDEQEQFQIKSTCLEAILELLITYKTFPIVGNKLSHFHHTTRWSHINCDSISLKKLHKVQLLVAESNVFYHPNLERYLGTDTNGTPVNSIIGTSHFGVTQYDLNFIWQQMETYAQLTTADGTSDATADGESLSSHTSDKTLKSSGTRREDTATRNYRYFTTQSGVDFKSSSQLIFDVLTQIIENNHILVLPNLVKFCEICESREQIKWIKDKALKLQETIPMDDTISHQHLIYLLCKTQAMLIPTFGELQQLCTLIATYLKSSHIFIRNATLTGVLCLLECCSKTNTSIGKLSEELSLLRELIVGYINRHGIIDASVMQCSDTHTKLVWTLNYCLIEWTSKFVPQCHLLSNTVIAAGNFLRKTSNEDVYLCVLHGLERMVVISNSGNGSGGSGHVIGGAVDGNVGGGAVAGVGGIVTPALRHKIEKLALELVKLENEKFSIPALQLLLTCMYVGSAKQLENTELSNGIVQDDPEIIAQQTDKVDILLHCIKSSTRDAAWIYGQVLCQIIRDLVPPNEILTKVIKEFLAINQPHCDVIAMIVYQVFRCAIDSSFLKTLQDWLICSLPTFLALPEQKGVWCLSVIFLSASINLHLIKLFPVVLGAREFRKLGQHEIALFVTAAQDFHAKLSAEQRMRFRDAFAKFHKNQVYAKMLHSLW